MGSAIALETPSAPIPVAPDSFTQPPPLMNANDEIQQGKRFTFGRNWASFLQTIDDSRISIAVESLKNLLQVESLQGRRFLDIGCGSGLFSLAARQLGAEVHSFDFDPTSVACAEELRRRFDAQPEGWTIEIGSALDEAYLTRLGEFDVVYSWGVLHHTGSMWRALELAPQRVAAEGRLALALYNDQGWRSRLWLRVKQLYCSGLPGRTAVLMTFLPWFLLRTCLVSLVRRRNEFATYRRNRGMSIAHDWIDWLGGLPFEVVSFEQVQQFYEARGFRLINGKRTRRLGCHEFCFVRLPGSSPGTSSEQ